MSVLKPPNYNRILAFDTETVGLKPNYIISLAYIFFENGKKVAQDCIIMNPDYPISPEASKVNGFTNEMVKDKPKFNEVWPSIKDYFNDSIWQNFNSPFDKRAVYTEFDRYGIEIPESFYVCDVLENAKKLVPKSEVPNYRLGTMCEYFGIKLDNWHSADADTLACVKVFNKLVKLSNGDLIIRSRFNNIYVPNSKKEED